MDALGTLKQISETIKKYNDLELMKQIIDLQTSVFELQSDNLSLRKRISTLEDAAAERQKVTLKASGECNFYFAEGEDIPFCPRCYEGEQKLVHLSNSESWSGGVRRSCIVCNSLFYEKAMDNSPTRITVRRRW